MRMYEGNFTAADGDGTGPDGLQLDCVAEKLDTRGAEFYTDGTYTVGGIILQHNRVSQVSHWSTLVADHTGPTSDRAQISLAVSALRVATTNDFEGDVKWRLIIPDRSEVHIPR